jgi:hypothetical protein
MAITINKEVYMNIGDYERIPDIEVRECTYCSKQASHYDGDGNPICVDCLRKQAANRGSFKGLLVGMGF